MKYLLTGEQMRAADHYTIEKIGLPSMVLMERAALKVVECMEREQLDFSNILVICGAGNNGGDGYAVARLLFMKGYHVEILFAGKEASRSTENALQANIAEELQIPLIRNLEKKEYTVIIDALLGIGLKREITGTYAKLLETVNHMSGVKVAIDIPSGIHDTTGMEMGIAFHADLTVTLAFQKTGLFFQNGSLCSGKIVTADIGIPQMIVSKDKTVTYSYEREDLYQEFPKRKKNSHKGTYGKVLFIAGSKGMAGAAYFNAKAAYAVGAGVVQIYTHEENRAILQTLLPQAIITTYHSFEPETLNTLFAWADIVGIGSGIGTDEIAAKFVQYTLQHVQTPCLVDADGLNLLSEHMEWLDMIQSQMIFTPHMKEMTRLLHCEMKELQAHRMEMLSEFISQYPVVCVLKDARTLVAENNTQVYLNQSGNSAMAKAGSGDILSGMIAGILAQQTECCKAACLGVFLHGLAGDCAKTHKGTYSVSADDIIDGISNVLKEM